jgi:hypothetical protein
VLSPKVKLGGWDMNCSPRGNNESGSSVVLCMLKQFDMLLLSARRRLVADILKSRCYILKKKSQTLKNSGWSME